MRRPDALVKIVFTILFSALLLLSQAFSLPAAQVAVSSGSGGDCCQVVSCCCVSAAENLPASPAVPVTTSSSSPELHGVLARLAVMITLQSTAPAESPVYSCAFSPQIAVPAFKRYCSYLI